MRSLVLLLPLAACGSPVTGTLPEGTWAGPHYVLTVQADGEADLEGDCAHADLGAIEAVDGELLVTLNWTADVPLDTVTPATLSANVSETRLDGQLSSDDGTWTEEVSLKLGAEPSLMKCQ